MVSTTSGTLVRERVEDGWGKVADDFRADFEGNPGEVGAAYCIYVGGHPVVDLWGGLADREANRQPVTSIVEAIRALLSGQPVDNEIWVALAWCLGILVVAYVFALLAFKRKTA